MDALHSIGQRSRRAGLVGLLGLTLIWTLAACGGTENAPSAAPTSSRPPSTPGLKGTVTVVAGMVGVEDGTAANGPALQIALTAPTAAAAGPNGSFYVADRDSDVVLRVDSTGVATIVAGMPGQRGDPVPGAALHSPLSISDDPGGLAVDNTGDLYISNGDSAQVVKVDPSGVLSIVAGTTAGAGLPTPGPATSSQLGEPHGLAVDAQNNLYIADSGNNVVEKVTPDGQLAVFAGVPGHQGPAVAVAGSATSSRLDAPNAVAVGRDGTVYIVNGDSVARVTTAGDLSIVAGQPTASGDAEYDSLPSSGPATDSRLTDLEGIAVGTDGSLYLAAYDDHQVLRVSPTGDLGVLLDNDKMRSAVAHQAPDVAAKLAAMDPLGLAVDGGGSLYVPDYSNHVVFKVS